MKNLIVYLNPRKGFDQDYNTEKLVEVQIDSILEFWDKKDVLFATNFPYSYHGIESMVVPDELFCKVDDKSSKVNVVIHLLEQGLLDELTWLHDLDAFQLHPFEVELEKDLGLCTYEWKRDWQTGSIFFKPEAKDVFAALRSRIYWMRRNEEPALMTLTDSNNGFSYRVQKLNVTYNLGMRNLPYLLSLAEKPCKVAHFPPWWEGMVELYRPILTDRLIQLIEEKA